MSEILIHHCHLRIVRQTGWAWGPDPQRIADAAVRALPNLLARQLEGLWDDSHEFEYTAPLRVSLPIRISDLWVSDRGDDEPIETSLSRDLQVRLEQSLRTTFLDDDPTFVDATIPPNTKSLDPADAFHLAPQSNTLLPLLIAWRDQGVLADRIKFISLASLEFWRDNLSSLRGSSAPPSTAAIDAVLEEFKDTVLRLSDDRDELLRCWLVLAVEIADRLGVLPGECAVQQALERIIGTTHRQSDSPIQVGQSSEAREPGTLVGESRPSLSRMSTTNHQPGQQSTPTSERKVLYEGEFAVGSVLPLLLLGPLARVGYWQTLCAVLETAELKSDRHLFAAALAFKVLDPIKPGLVRSAASMASAAVFAALSAAPSASDLAEFARRIAQYVSPLDALLADELLKGHDARQPLLLERVAENEGLLLVESEGVFPIAWSPTVEPLLPLLSRFLTKPLLIPQTTAEPALLDRLDRANVRFVTDAPPARDEPWRSLRHPVLGRWWTNDTDTAESQLLAATTHMARTSEETVRLWHLLVDVRPLTSLSDGGTFDQCLTMAAATGLGMIAWTLWREREPVAPYVALERFGDLDGCVRFSREAIQVRLPLGRRYRDLYDHGFLKDVHHVPWFDGRVLKFSGG